MRKNLLRRGTTALPTLIAALAFSGRALAAPMIDQSNTGVAEGAVLNTSTTGAQGQSFKPTLNGVNFVTIKIADFDTSGPGGQVFLGMYKGAKGNGGQIGSYSEKIKIPAGQFGAMKEYTFNFPELVPLTPGETYSFAMLVDSGQFGIATTDGDQYADGAFFAGFLDVAGDMYFVEGIVPEPATVTLAAAASTALLARRQSRRAYRPARR